MKMPRAALREEKKAAELDFLKLDFAVVPQTQTTQTNFYVYARPGWF